MAQRALAWVAQRALAWVAQRALAWVAQRALEEGGKRVEAGLRLEEGVRVSCLLRQPRYQLQEVQVPFERIGRVLDLLMPGRRVVHGPSRVLWPPWRLNRRVQSGTRLLEPPHLVPHTVWHRQKSYLQWLGGHR